MGGPADPANTNYLVGPVLAPAMDKVHTVKPTTVQAQCRTDCLQRDPDAARSQAKLANDIYPELRQTGVACRLWRQLRQVDLVPLGTREGRLCRTVRCCTRPIGFLSAVFKTWPSYRGKHNVQLHLREHLGGSVRTHQLNVAG
jgi:hypothetical protein